MKKTTKKYLFLIFLLITIIVLMPKAYASDPGRAAFPEISDIFGAGNPSPYMTIYADNYHLDMKDMRTLEVIRNSEVIFNDFANLLFSMQVYLARLLIIIVYYAFEIDLYGIFSGLVNSVIGEMKIALFDELSLIAILLLGIYYIVKMVSDQKTQIWIAIIQTIILITLALAFFNNPTGLLQGIDGFSKEISRSVLAGTYKATNQGETPNVAVTAAANDIWMMFVHRPWQILQFGDINAAEERQTEILSLPPKSEARQAIINEMAQEGKMFTPDWGIRRTAFILLYMIPMLIMGLIIGVLSILILGYQFLTIFYALMGIFVFILALIPFFGPKIISNWASKLLANGFIKVIISFILAMIFAFNSALFNLIGTYGWFIVLMLQILVMAMIVWKRKDFLEMITTMRMAVQHKNLNKTLRKDANLESRINNYTDKIQFNRKEKQHYQYDDAVHSKNINDHITKQAYKDSTYEASSKDHGIIEVQLQQDGELSHVNDNLKILAKKAEDLLERKYESEKKEAEEKAEKLNKDPDYSSFVKRVHTREALGADRFSNREISAVAGQIDRAQRSGGSIDDVYVSMIKKEDKIERPKDLAAIKIAVAGENLEVDRKEAYNILKEQESRDYTNEFNQRYDKEYDKAFFDELFRKYGKENVRMMMDKMKVVEEREDKIIENPAGYLITALKNNKRDKIDNVSLRKGKEEAKESNQQPREQVQDIRKNAKGM